MMSTKGNKNLSEVEKANLICRVRALVGQDLSAFAKNLDVTEGVLRSLEEGNFKIPESVINRTANMIGVQPNDLSGKRIEDIMKALDIGVLSLIFPAIPRHEIFDLIFYYNQIEEKRHKQKVFDVLKLMSQPLPSSQRSRGVKG
jgi:hypothetical protein